MLKFFPMIQSLLSLSLSTQHTHTHIHTYRHTHTCVIPEGFEAEFFSLKYNPTTSECKIHSVEVDPAHGSRTGGSDSSM